MFNMYYIIVDSNSYVSKCLLNNHVDIMIHYNGGANFITTTQCVRVAIEASQ